MWVASYSGQGFGGLGAFYAVSIISNSNSLGNRVSSAACTSCEDFCSIDDGLHDFVEPAGHGIHYQIQPWSAS